MPDGRNKEGEASYQIVDGRCIGCGLCVSACPTEASIPVAEAGDDTAPADFWHDTLSTIRAERDAIEAGKGQYCMRNPP